jgi:uncharacterized protein (TIGR03118 family)
MEMNKTDTVRKRATVAPSVRETIAFALRGDATAFQWLVAVFHFFCFSILGLVLSSNNAAAQTIGYRQTNLASNLPNVANNVTPNLVDPWGIAFLSGQPFFIADNEIGRITVHDATGFGAAPGGFTIPNADGTGFDDPTGIVADQNSFFGSSALVKPFVVVTEQGTVFTWGPNTVGDVPQHATLVINHSSQGAVYKGVAILNSTVAQPALAVTDFHGGFIETFLPGFDPVALAGSFTDPNLPAGYAPYGIQVIGSQVFVTYAMQDTAKHDPVAGPGNGIVSIFDMDGSFVRRFATGGALNAPWGIAQASANFGPFSNNIVIGNAGDGNINAFDLATGNFVGKLKDGDGHAIVETGLHGLAFRSDGFGDPDTLYFTSQFSNEDDGLFGAITTGLVTLTRVSAPGTPGNTSTTITATVAAALDNAGAPAGTVTFLDGTNPLGTATLVNGLATLDAVLTGVGAHVIEARYSGDGIFLPSSSQAEVQVTGLTTVLTLVAPAVAAPGSPVTLTATINSAGGIPTGEIVFHDGNTELGTSALNGTGVAILRIDTLAVGAHSLTASYEGDDKFGASTSATATINIANADFSLGASPSAATVKAGLSTQFMLTVTPAGGFADNVTFTCAPVTGITCSFSPATVIPVNGTASTALTVTTSASVSRYGLLTPELFGVCDYFLALSLFSLAILCAGKLQNDNRPSIVAAAASLTIVLVLAIGGCGGGGYGSSTQPNRGTASIMVTAQSASITHTTTINVTVQ